MLYSFKCHWLPTFGIFIQETSKSLPFNLGCSLVFHMKFSIRKSQPQNIHQCDVEIEIRFSLSICHNITIRLTFRTQKYTLEFIAHQNVIPVCLDHPNFPNVHFFDRKLWRWNHTAYSGYYPSVASKIAVLFFYSLVSSDRRYCHCSWWNHQWMRYDQLVTTRIWVHPERMI